MFEQNVEGVSRFIAIFQTDIPDKVGPIRSPRMQDLLVLPALGKPAFVHTGGNDHVNYAIQKAVDAGLVINMSQKKSPSSRCYFQDPDPSRQAPNNKLVDLTCIAGLATSAGSARPLFVYSKKAPAGTPDTERFQTPMRGHVVEWQWEPTAGRYVRYQNGKPHLSDGQPIKASNVVVMYVVYGSDSAEPCIPVARTVGSGKVVLHRNGVSVTGTWSRQSPSAPITLADERGRQIVLAPGKTFVELSVSSGLPRC